MSNLNKQPLADKLRPTSFKNFVGQSELLSEGTALNKLITSKKLHSMILWGPPGVGKTTLAKLLAENSDYDFAQMSAVLSGVKDLRNIVEAAKQNKDFFNKTTVLFVDEIHRFNKTQQDAFLPHIENGLITLIGATTENPSFEINKALLSRLQIYILTNFSELELLQILEQAIKQEKNLKLNIESETKKYITELAYGDARRLLNILEIILDSFNTEATPTSSSSKKNTTFPQETITLEICKKLLKNKVFLFDKGGDQFFQQLSAFHKSVRGSSPDGALYWMSRMIIAGCDPKVIARRLLAIASEDIGNADPQALNICLNAWDTYHKLGAFEGNRAISQAAVYCAVAPKSNAVYKAFQSAMEEAKNTSQLEVPLHLKNAPTALLKDLNYGKDYKYDHNQPNAFAKGQTYFPKELTEKVYYKPNPRGLEIKIKEKLDFLKK